MGNKKKRICPIEILVAIVDRDKSDIVCSILRSFKSKGQLISLSEGTAISKKVDFFGFGVTQRNTIWAIIPVEYRDNIMQQLIGALHLNKSNTGIAFTIPLKSSASTLFDLLEIKY